MTKSVKHKNSRKVELKKFKLKCGRKLKRAQNESKTDFKSRKILIREQLGDKSSSSIVTKKQLDIKELLSRLSHHSEKVRQDGVNGLKELVANNDANLLAPHISPLINGLAQCITDLSPYINSGAVKLIEVLIIKLNKLIEPYFGLLTSHLSYAMVHLNAGVQSNSLLLMDVFLSHAPSLIAQSSNIMLKNYLSLISKKMESSRGKFGTSFSLISNPNSKLTSQAWRIKLLSNLSKYISAILWERTKLQESTPRNMWLLIEKGSMPPLMKSTDGRSSVQEIKILIEEREAEKFISSLIPLLFQVWSEVQCDTSNISEGCPLSPASIQTLTSIVQIILSLWEITEIVTNESPLECYWFMDLLKLNLEKRILVGFPYCKLESDKNSKTDKLSKKLKLINIDEACKKLNILLANLSLRYLPNRSNMIRNISYFYSEILENDKIDGNFKLSQVVSAASCLLYDKTSLSFEDRERLLTSTLKGYQKMDHVEKHSLLQIPLTASDMKCKDLWINKGNSGLSQWMEHLIDECMTSKNPDPIITVLNQFKLRNTPGFAAAMNARKQEFKDTMGKNRSGFLGTDSRIEIIF